MRPHDMSRKLEPSRFLHKNMTNDMEKSFQLPWDRFWARWIDLVIHLLVSFLIAYFLVKNTCIIDLFHLNNDILKYAIFWVWICIAFVIYETFFLCVFTATPGKALFRIRVFSSDGKKLNVRAAAIRSITLYFFGLYFYIFPTITPIIGFWLSSYYYKKTGKFRWDKFSNCILHQNSLSSRRRNISIGCSVFCIATRHIPDIIIVYEILSNTKK